MSNLPVILGGVVAWAMFSASSATVAVVAPATAARALSGPLWLAASSAPAAVAFLAARLVKLRRRRLGSTSSDAAADDAADNHLISLPGAGGYDEGNLAACPAAWPPWRAVLAGCQAHFASLPGTGVGALLWLAALAALASALHDIKLSSKSSLQAAQAEGRLGSSPMKRRSLGSAPERWLRHEHQEQSTVRAATAATAVALQRAGGEALTACAWAVARLLCPGFGAGGGSAVGLAAGLAAAMVVLAGDAALAPECAGHPAAALSLCIARKVGPLRALAAVLAQVAASCLAIPALRAAASVYGCSLAMDPAVPAGPSAEGAAGFDVDGGVLPVMIFPAWPEAWAAAAVACVALACAPRRPDGYNGGTDSASGGARDMLGCGAVPGIPSAPHRMSLSHLSMPSCSPARIPSAQSDESPDTAGREEAGVTSCLPFARALALAALAGLAAWATAIDGDRCGGDSSGTTGVAVVLGAVARGVSGVGPTLAIASTLTSATIARTTSTATATLTSAQLLQFSAWLASAVVLPALAAAAVGRAWALREAASSSELGHRGSMPSSSRRCIGSLGNDDAESRSSADGAAASTLRGAWAAYADALAALDWEALAAAYDPAATLTCCVLDSSAPAMTSTSAAASGSTAGPPTSPLPLRSPLRSPPSVKHRPLQSPDRLVSEVLAGRFGFPALPESCGGSGAHRSNVGPCPSRSRLGELRGHVDGGSRPAAVQLTPVTAPPVVLGDRCGVAGILTWLQATRAVASEPVGGHRKKTAGAESLESNTTSTTAAAVAALSGSLVHEVVHEASCSVFTIWR